MFIAQQKSLIIGGRQFTESEINRFESGTTGVILYGNITTTGRWTTLRLANGTAGYQVPASKTLKFVAAQFSYLSTSAIGCNLLYGDTDVGIDGAAAPTNPVYPGGSILNTLVTFNATLKMMQDVGGIDFNAPTGKYPAFTCTQAFGRVIAYGFID